jgi:SAM-dependent methyltransferase
MNKGSKWPKTLPLLSKEQIRIKEQLISLWYNLLPSRFSFIERFNHKYPIKMMNNNRSQIRTIEIGAGIGGHIAYEDLTRQEYFAIELKPEMAEIIKERFPKCTVVVQDCQETLPFPSQTFDRIIAVHVLEHLPDLPSALEELRRVCKKDGIFSAVIPCEGGLFYSLGRSLSTKRILKKKFGKGDYRWLFESEHCNYPDEIIAEIKKLFQIVHTVYFPLVVPIKNLNLCIGLTMEALD